MTPKDAITSFLNWLDNNSILIAHNANFDARLLVGTVNRHGYTDHLKEKVEAFSDRLGSIQKPDPHQQEATPQQLFPDCIRQGHPKDNSNASCRVWIGPQAS